MKNLWCDTMACENNVAWTIGCRMNALFRLDFCTKRYEFITDFPDASVADFRVNPYCMKVRDDLYFFPDLGECIWIYNITSKKIYKIVLENPEKVRISMCIAFCFGNSIYAISRGLKQIVEISVSERKIIGIYEMGEYGQDAKISDEGCIAKGKIYFTVPEKNLICEFSAETKKIVGFDLTGDMAPQTICYDGKDFWLTGRTKEIVRWNREKKEIISYADIPSSVGMFEIVDGVFRENISDVQFSIPFFRWSVKIGDKVWFIPLTTNKLLYADINTYEINVCEIESENEDEKSWTRILQTKYCFECVFQERYLFLYSYKNKRYLIIDSMADTAQPVDIIMEEESRKRLYERMVEKRELIVEPDVIDLSFFLQMMDDHDERKEKKTENGKRIFQELEK